MTLLWLLWILLIAHTTQSLAYRVQDESACYAQSGNSKSTFRAGGNYKVLQRKILTQTENSKKMYTSTEISEYLAAYFASPFIACPVFDLILF